MITSWTTFEQIGNLKTAAEQCKFKVRFDLREMAYIFSDGWKVDAKHLVERSVKAITSWLTVLWTIRIGRDAEEKTTIYRQGRNGSRYIQCN